MKESQVAIQDSGLGLRLKDQASSQTTTRTRPNILQEADAAVGGPRQGDYGHPAINFQRIADAWKALFGCEVTPAQASLAMVVVKLSRLVETPDHRDSLVDLAGYARVTELIGDGPEAR